MHLPWCVWKDRVLFLPVNMIICKHFCEGIRRDVLLQSGTGITKWDDYYKVGWATLKQ